MCVSSVPEIECYPGQLNQVFLNLIANAIDTLESSAIAGEIATPTICIRTMLKEERAIVCIADSGLRGEDGSMTTHSIASVIFSVSTGTIAIAS